MSIYVFDGLFKTPLFLFRFHPPANFLGVKTLVTPPKTGAERIFEKMRKKALTAVAYVAKLPVVVVFFETV